MFKKLLLLYFILLLPVSMVAQQKSYVSNRLLIKYESPERLQKLKINRSIDPQSEVEQFLQKADARTIRPLLSRPARQQLRQKMNSRAQELLQLREVIFNRDINPQYLAAKIKRMPGVAYAEPKYIRHMFETPDDPVLEKFIDFHRFEDAWDISTGSPEIVIAVVDGGVSYIHPDLDDKLWVNQSEIPAAIRPQVDQDADGSITSTEVKQYLENNDGDYDGQSGIRLDDALHPDSPFINDADDDGNGYPDDLFGWDFWDSGSITQAIEDNNPIADGTDHGTHVTGIAAAETNNDTDVAGAGYNSRYMAIKAGGTQQAPRTVGFGFEGIIYAAQQGADVINCSWGGGGFSQAEMDVISFANELGAIVVAASGNRSTPRVDYPAAYSNILGVGSVETSGAIAGYSSFGYKLDVLATGSGIESTTFGGNLTSKSGTSMAAPVASGLAALIKDIHPDWSPERIKRQIRTSGDLVDAQNPNHFRNRLGHGSINAFRALNTNNPGLKVIASRFQNDDGNKLQIDQPGTLNMQLVNVGAPASNIEMQLQSLINQGITIDSPSQQLQNLSPGDTLDVSFNLTITRNFNVNRTPTLRLGFNSTDGSYSDFNVVQYNRFLYDLVDVNRVKTSLAADGTVGFTRPNNRSGGVGFIPREQTMDGYEEGRNLLFEGGLIVEIDDRVYDAVRTQDGGLSRDFTPENVFTTTATNAVSDLDGHASFNLQSDTTRSITIDLKTYAFNNPQLSNVVFLNYTLRNNSSFQILKNVYLGLFNDWDIGNSANNSTTYISADSLMYLSEPSPNSEQPVAAVANLGPISGILAIDNTMEGSSDTLSFGLYDGFTDTEKSRALKSQKIKTSVENTDASAVTASGPYTLNPGAEITVGFAYAFGDNMDELRAQIIRARSQKPFEVSSTGRALADTKPDETRMFQNYPNPFSGETQIYFDLSESSHVTLTIYDVLGRKVRTILNEELEVATHFVDFNAEGLSSGIYFARLKTSRGVRTIPMTFIK